MAQTHPSASIYVGDLASEVSEGLLFEIFKRVGTVSSIRVCRDNITKRSLGYAYVNFVNVADAQRAIDTLNNTHIKGRPCRIMWSLRDPSLRKSGLGNVFIRNLDPQIGPKELHDTFSQFGNIVSCKVASYSSGQSKGYGYVHFENSSSAEQAIKIVNGKRIGAETVQVTNFIPRPERLQRIEQTWTNVYVKDLDLSVHEEQLHAIFSEFGEVTSCVVMRKENRDSKGFGFINFKHHRDAVIAVQQMDKREVAGKPIICCRAQKKAERAAELRKLYEIKRRERIHKYQGLNVYVKHLEDHITEERLKQEFEPYGKINSIKIMTNEQGQSKGFGFVCFSTSEEALTSVNEIGRNRILPGCSKPLYVAIHEPKETRNQRFTGRGRNPKPMPNVPQPGQVFQQGAQTGPMYQPQQGGIYYPQQVFQQQMIRQPPWPNPYHQSMGSHAMPPPGGRQQVPPQQQSGNRFAAGGVRNANQPGNQPNVRKGNDVSDINAISEDQRGALEQRIYDNITVREGPDLAKKITGMIVFGETTNQDLLDILNDESKLEQVIGEAKAHIMNNTPQEEEDN